MKPDADRDPLFKILFAEKADYSRIHATPELYCAFIKFCVPSIIRSNVFKAGLEKGQPIQSFVSPADETWGMLTLINAHERWEMEGTYRVEHGLTLDANLGAAKKSFCSTMYSEGKERNSTRSAGWDGAGISRFIDLKKEVIDFRKNTLPAQADVYETYVQEHFSGHKQRKRKRPNQQSEVEVNNIQALADLYKNPLLCAFEI